MEATVLLIVSSYPALLMLRWISVLSCVFEDDAAFLHVTGFALADVGVVFWGDESILA